MVDAMAWPSTRDGTPPRGNRARARFVGRSVGRWSRSRPLRGRSRSSTRVRSFVRSFVRSTARRRFESNRIEIDRFRDENRRFDRRFDRASPRGGDFGSIARRARDESVREGRPWVGLIDCIDLIGLIDSIGVVRDDDVGAARNAAARTQAV